MSGSRLNSDFPANSPVVDSQGNASVPWYFTFARWQSITGSLQQSGPTSTRPKLNLWVGRMFYDTTLGYPVWVHSVRPTVWHNAAGAAV